MEKEPFFHYGNDNSAERKVKPRESWDRLLRAKQAAELLNTPDRTIRYLADQGILPGSKVGRSWRFWLSDVLQYLDGDSGGNRLAL
jgi:excisionase family DNA binding protein